MEFRFIEYKSKIYVVRGIGYDDRYDPPDVFYCAELEVSVLRSLLSLTEVIIPTSHAEEITDARRILAIWTLFGR